VGIGESDQNHYGTTSWSKEGIKMWFGRLKILGGHI